MTIAKRSAKRLKFLNPDPFTKRESAVSNFHTNLYGAIKSHNITAQSAPDFGHALFNPHGTAHASIMFFGRIYQTEDFVLQLFSSLSTSYSGFRALKALTKCLHGCWPYGHKRCESFIDAENT